MLNNRKISKSKNYKSPPSSLLPLSIAVSPVRTNSLIPKGSRSLIKLAILSWLPVASITRVSIPTSTTWARKILAVSMLFLSKLFRLDHNVQSLLLLPV